MEARDLMIGDKLKTVFSQKVVKVKEIKQSCIYTEDNGYEYNEIEPIPLTPEILEKNGFEKEWDEDIMLMVCDNIIVETGDNYKLYKDGKMYLRRVLAPLYYVHQLQHALRLCGIEKEIIL